MRAQLKSKWVSRRAAEKTSLTAQDLPTFFPMECNSGHSMGLVEGLLLLPEMFPSYYISSSRVFQTHFSSPAPRDLSCQFRTTPRSEIIYLHSSLPPPNSASPPPPQSLIAIRLTRHFHLLNQAFVLLLCRSRQVQSDRTRVRLCRA